MLAVFGPFTLEELEWTVEAAADRLSLGMRIAYRFFKNLADAGLISPFAPGRYVVGPAIVQLDWQTRLLDPLIRVAQPVMRCFAAIERHRPALFVADRTQRPVDVFLVDAHPLQQAFMDKRVR